MIATRFMELRKRRGLMITLVGVTIGIPTLFLVIRLLLHAVRPKSYGPAGGYDIFTHLVVGVLYVFGFIVAATLGCTAGSIDLTEGMFRHLVVTGRSRLALYLARIPAGLAIIVPAGRDRLHHRLRACACSRRRPRSTTKASTCPPGCRSPALENWAANHADEVVCDFPYNGPTPVERRLRQRPLRRPRRDRSSTDRPGAGTPADNRRRRDAQGRGHRRSPNRTTPTTPDSSSPRRPRS